MVCHNSVTTKTGKFTLYADEVTRCEAKKRCKRLGRILAPITNEYDRNAIKSLQKNNEFSPCAFGNGHFSFYHVGLDVKNVGGTFLKEFTDGTKWDECEMGDLYDEDKEAKNPIALYVNLLPYSLTIKEEGNISRGAVHRYICLQPATKREDVHVTSSEPLVQQSSVSPFNLFAGIGGLMVVVCAFAAVGWKKMRMYEKEMKKREAEVKELKQIVQSENHKEI